MFVIRVLAGVRPFVVVLDGVGVGVGVGVFVVVVGIVLGSFVGVVVHVVGEAAGAAAIRPLVVVLTGSRLDGITVAESGQDEIAFRVSGFLIFDLPHGNEDQQRDRRPCFHNRTPAISRLSRPPRAILTM